MSEFLGGVCNLFCKIRGGQYFAAEGRKIEGPPPGDVFGSFPNNNNNTTPVYVGTTTVR